MKPIDFSHSPIAPIVFGIFSLLQLIANLLYMPVSNRFELQVLGNIYIYKKYIYLLTYYSIYTLTFIFWGVFHARIRACAREAIGLIPKLSMPISSPSCKKVILTFYAHYCLDCQMMYFGKELNVVKPCIRCGSTNVINGPLMSSKEKSANVAGK